MLPRPPQRRAVFARPKIGGQNLKRCDGRHQSWQTRDTNAASEQQPGCVRLHGSHLMQLRWILPVGCEGVVDAHNRHVGFNGQRIQVSTVSLGGLRDEAAGMNVKDDPGGSGQGRGPDR